MLTAVGGALLVLSTWLSFRFGANMMVAASICMTEIVLLSLFGHFVSTILLPVIAIGSLDYFFATPVFSFRVDIASDFWALIAFFASSSIVSWLVNHVRRLGAIHRQQAQLLDLTHDSVMVRGMDDTISYWNRGAEAIFGWKADEALGEMSHSLLRSRYPIDFEQIKQTLLESGYWEGEVVHATKNGSVVATATRCSILCVKQGVPTAILETSTNITERKRNEDAVGHGTRFTTIGELGTSIAHELGQPIAAIGAESSAGLRWLNRDSPNINEALSSLQHIGAECRRATEIIRHVRAMTKRKPLQVTSLAINDVIRDVIPLVHRELLNHQATLKTRLDPDLPPVLGDPVQLAQVTINLVMNGLQAMAAVANRARELVIESRRGEAGEVLVAVCDSGAGIAPNDAERLFEPFFTTKPEGMGVGLSICQAIVQSHGGEIRIRNNTEHGVTVEFSVPAIGAHDGAL
ncbi:PAS domain-containing sensor histidine kinase [Paraburkholderia humisilvae]|uniref:histidine kinase n=1 Tax=Paraburkholderia humisilvae TaxID=627669 RepID=A0A6J5D6A6_9BURK|nr:PAS domain-containing sensor histidine kinase [Paraburkholderia humisilvae]CAB3748981.1 Adaptive-response sensory-kinase SasA [Paraburkholderia humisilvae]